MIKNLLLATITLAIAGSAVAQSPKATEQSKNKPAKADHGTFLQSHSKANEAAKKNPKNKHLTSGLP